MPLMTLCMATRKELSSTVITGTIVTCRCIAFAATFHSWRNCETPSAMPVAARWRRSRKSRAPFASALGARCALLCGPTAGSPVRRSWHGARQTQSITAWDWRAISGWAPAWARASENFTRGSKPERSRCLAAALRTLSIARARAGAARAGWWAKPRSSTKGKIRALWLPTFPLKASPASPKSAFAARPLYEKLYCARGEMENRIKEAQQDLFADRTSTSWMASNQLRLWFSAFAHLMLSVLRAEVLRGTDLASATLGQILLKLFKIGARIKISCRRIHLELASAYPYQETFRRACANLCAMPAG